MASTYVNAFDLLGVESSDECDDIAVLSDRIKNRTTVEQVPSSPTKMRKEYVVYGEAVEQIQYEDDEVPQENGDGVEINGGDVVAEDGWKAVPKRVHKQVQNNGNGPCTFMRAGRNYNGDRRGRGCGRVQRASSVSGSAQSKGEGHVNGESPRRNGGGSRGRGNGVYDGRGRGRGRGGFRYPRTNNGQDGAGADANLDSQADVVTVLEPSRAAEGAEKETVEEQIADVPEPEETAEEKKAREKEEQLQKVKEEERRKRQEEAAERRREREEEAKKMTLAQYEKILLEKKQAQSLHTAEAARRVVAVDKDLENMKVVAKKRDDDEPLTTETKLKKSDSLKNKGPKPVAADLAGLFRPASYRVSNSGRVPEQFRPASSDNSGRGQGSKKYTDGPKRITESQDTVMTPAAPCAETSIVADDAVPIATDDDVPIVPKNDYPLHFPVIGFALPKPAPKPSTTVTAVAPEPSAPVATPSLEPAAPVANPSVLPRSTTKPNGSVSSKKRDVRRGSGNPPGSAANRRANRQ